MIFSINYIIPFVLFVKAKIIFELNKKKIHWSRYSQCITAVSYSEPFTVFDNTS